MFWRLLKNFCPAATYSPDGKWVATISQDNTARATELPADLAKLGAPP
jgi:WD40 repeat protein